MITEYKRPRTLEEALDLLSQPDIRPLGGGTNLTQIKDESFIAVDLQALGLDKIRQVGEKLEIGAAATLSQLQEFPSLPPALAESVRLETTLNLRNMGTVAGTLVVCDGRSTFSTAMLALDARLFLQDTHGAKILSLGDFLPLRLPQLQGKLITKIEIPLNCKFSFENLARTPSDKAIVCAALASWPSGRTRLALGGWGVSPLLALDGNEPGGVESAARNAYSEAGDEWASAEYRSEMAALLAKRCFEKNNQ